MEKITVTFKIGEVSMETVETGVIVGKMGGECYLFADGDYNDLKVRVQDMERIAHDRGWDMEYKVLTIESNMLKKLRKNAEIVSETFKPYFPEKNDTSVTVDLDKL